MNTTQVLFDAVTLHLLTQREQAINTEPGHSGQCLYRTDKGLKCALGALIPDSIYTEAFEGAIANDLFGATDPDDEHDNPEFREHRDALLSYFRAEYGVTDDNLWVVSQLMSDLQRVHDSFPPTEWPYRLLHVAKTFSLDPALVDQMETQRLCQTLYEMVAHHLLAQNGRSTRDLREDDHKDSMSCFGPICAYRGEHGRKCAAGAVIPDEGYTRALEGTLISTILVDREIFDNHRWGSPAERAAAERARAAMVEEYGQCILADKTVRLLSALQHVHDRFPPTSWPTELVNVATHLDLKPYTE